MNVRHDRHMPDAGALLQSGEAPLHLRCEAVSEPLRAMYSGSAGHVLPSAVGTYWKTRLGTRFL